MVIMAKKKSSLVGEKETFYAFLGFLALGVGIVTLNPSLCCGLYGNPFWYFITSVIMLLTGAAFIAQYGR